MGADENISVAETTSNEKLTAAKNADATLQFIEDHGGKFPPLSTEAEKKLRRKLYWRLMTLLSTVNIMLFIDKSTLGYAAILGLFEETGITQAQYNNLNTIFYVGYLAFQWPGHYLMQRLNLNRYLSSVVLSLAILMFLHCVATRYAGLVVIRLALGAAEAVVVPAMEVTISMFFNRQEMQFLQPVLWISCIGAQIPAGLISYGLLYTTGHVLPWKLLYIITGSITLLVAAWVWLDYPSNPAVVRWLSVEEKCNVISRVHASHQSSIEQKQFKMPQFLEAMKDPISWLFALQAFTLMFCNNLTYGQKNLLVTSLGVSPLISTLIAVASGAFGIFNCCIATIALRWYPKKMALHATFWCLPAVAGGIGMVTIAWHKTIPLLACMFLASQTYGVAYIIALGWTNSTVAGYTKKLARNILFMLGYSIGNLVSPQIWVGSTAPRFYGAWTSMIVVSWCGTPAILWIIHLILLRRNKARQKHLGGYGLQEPERGYIERLDESGKAVRVSVELAMLDLTDLENKSFIYPL